MVRGYLNPVTNTPSLGTRSPGSRKEVTCPMSEYAPGTEPAFVHHSLRREGGQPCPHTADLGSTNFQKNFIYCFKWQNVIGVCEAPGRTRGDPGWAWGSAPPITKIKGFYKKCYKLVSKENPREAGGGSRDRGGKTAREGPKPPTTSDGIPAWGRGSWTGDTKCINVPPRTLLRGGGGQRLQPGAWWGSSRLLTQGPHRSGTA